MTSNLAGNLVPTESDLGPGSRNKEARKRRMIDAALSLFAEEGYVSVSTRRIAERAGCSETLLFRYFGGKRGLLLAISEQLSAQSLPHPPTTDHSRGFREYMEDYLVFQFEQMKLGASALKVVVPELINDPELAAEFRRIHDEAVSRMAGELRELQHRGDIGDQIDVVAIGMAVVGICFSLGFVSQVLFGMSPSELRKFARAFAMALEQGVEQGTPLATLPESLRRDTVSSARDAREGLERVIELLSKY